VRSLPPFPLYSLAGAVNGGIGGGKDCSEDCGNVGAARTGVGGWLEVLLRYGGIAGTLSISSSGVMALALLLASLSSSNLSQWATVLGRHGLLQKACPAHG
jgi:hypothetical protein